MTAVLIVLIIICAVLALFYAVGMKFVRVLILRQDNFPTPETGASSSSLLEPTGKALWAHNIPYFGPFRELPFDEISIVSDDGLTLRADMLRGSGTGKTTICNQLASLGAYVIDADRVAREILRPPVLAQLRRAFGKNILLADGSLDRKKLGKLVFNDGEQLKIGRAHV